MKITRIDVYDDERFSQEVLLQHGAFIIDDIHPCAFLIINSDSAVVDCQANYQIEDIIKEFRFYAEHIINFYDKDQKLIKSYPPIALFMLDIEKIQPSQFYIDINKLDAVKQFVKSSSDVVIPVALVKGEYVALDGHTRLYCANDLGIKCVKVFLGDYDRHTLWFVKQAKKRKIFRIDDLILLNNDEFSRKWNGLCDRYFEKER